MTYHELVEKVAKAMTAVDASAVAEHVAVQVNVTGEGEGAFYIEVADGKLTVEPYDYVDRDAMLTASAEDLLAVAAGKLTLEAAIAEGRMALEGNYDKVMVLNNVFAQLPVKKRRTAAKKKTETADKDAAAKPAAKRGRPKKSAKEETVAAAAPEAVAEVKAEAPAKKSTAKKSAAKKPAAKKTTKKAAKTEE